MTPEERAKSLFGENGCTCGGIDIGVGVQHYPTCGMPTMEDIADSIHAAISEEREACAAIVGATCGICFGDPGNDHCGDVEHKRLRGIAKEIRARSRAKGEG